VLNDHCLYPVFQLHFKLIKLAYFPFDPVSMGQIKMNPFFPYFDRPAVAVVKKLNNFPVIINKFVLITLILPAGVNHRHSETICKSGFKVNPTPITSPSYSCRLNVPLKMSSATCQTKLALS
jgi:hypothetical protein